MGKNCVSVAEIKKTIERLIAENFTTDEDFPFEREDSLSERLDSMSICLVIVQLEDIYKIQFPIKNFCKDDSITILAEKVYQIWQTKD